MHRKMCMAAFVKPFSAMVLGWISQERQIFERFRLFFFFRLMSAKWTKVPVKGIMNIPTQDVKVT